MPKNPTTPINRITVPAPSREFDPLKEFRRLFQTGLPETFTNQFLARSRRGAEAQARSERQGLSQILASQGLQNSGARLQGLAGINQRQGATLQGAREFIGTQDLSTRLGALDSLESARRFGEELDFRREVTPTREDLLDQRRLDTQMLAAILNAFDVNVTVDEEGNLVFDDKDGVISTGLGNFTIRDRKPRNLEETTPGRTRR